MTISCKHILLTISAIVAVVACATIPIHEVSAASLAENTKTERSSQTFVPGYGISDRTISLDENAQGILRGRATINQRITEACPKLREPSAFGMKIYKGDTIAKMLNFAADGAFSVALPPGVYTVYSSDQEPGAEVSPDIWQRVLPRQVVIQSGKVTTLNVEATYACNAM